MSEQPAQLDSHDASGERGPTLGVTGPAAQQAPYARRWRVFWVLGLANFIASIDMMFSNVALPTIATDFGLPLSGAAWIPLSGTLTIGALLLPMGNLADLVGRKRMQLAGIVLIGIGSMLAATAPSTAVLIAARMIASAGVAIVFTQMMSVVAAVFPDSERGRAIGAGIAASAIGMIIGPLAGGVLITSGGWRLAYVIIGLLTIPGLIATQLVFVESRISPARNDGSANFDWIGALLIATGITIAIIMLNEGNRQGWLSPTILAMAVVSAATLSSFVWWERRRQEPLLDLRYFGNCVFSSAIACRFLGMFGFASIFFLLPFFVQGVQGNSVNVVGFVFFAGAVGMGIGALISGRFEQNRVLLSFIGLALAAIANILFVFLSIDTPWIMVAGANIVGGFGFGIWNAPVWAILLSAVDNSSYSTAAAFMNLVRNTSQLFAVAIATAIVTALIMAGGGTGDLSEISKDLTGNTGEAFIAGARFVFIIGAAMSVAAMVVAAASLRGRGEVNTSDDPVHRRR